MGGPNAGGGGKGDKSGKGKGKDKGKGKGKDRDGKGKVKEHSSTERCTGTSANTSVFRFTHSSAGSVRLCATAGEASAVDCGSGSAGCSAASATPG